MRRILQSVVIVTVLISSRAVFAHDVSTSYARLLIEGSKVHLQFTIALADFHNGPNLDSNGDDEISQAELDAGIDKLAGTIESNYRLEAPDKPASITLEKYGLQGLGVIKLDLAYAFDHDVRDLKITSTLDRVTQANHQHLLVTGTGDQTRQGVLDAKNPSVNVHVGGQNSFEVFSDFLTLGIEQIFRGYDHLAFVAGLLLLTTTSATMGKAMAAFAVAHSTTLALSTFNVFSPATTTVASLIALSVVFVAIVSFTGKPLLAAWQIAFLFGLVHGFGFSNVLKEMDLPPQQRLISLLPFNLGLELGLACFISAAFPLIMLARRSSMNKEILSLTSLPIMGMGFYWFVQRTLLK